LKAPPSLALPNQKQQVSIHELRPLTLEDALLLAEVNSPTLKAAASQVEQAKSSLRAAISSWYPTVDLSASGLPEYFKSYSFQNPDFVPGTTIPAVTNPLTGEVVRPARKRDGENERYGREWQVNASLQVSWDIINPRRVPQIAAARDQYEQARDSYAIALRDLRLNTSTDYFNLKKPTRAFGLAKHRFVLRW
jgi:OMF family outer membrane factor